MGLFDWLSSTKRNEARGRRHELRGELDAAVEAYLAAGLRADAARALLARADAEPDPTRRMALCGRAAELGGETEQGRAAARRKALMRFDLARGPSGLLLGEELRSVAAELEALGEWEKAAEAYLLLGDEEGEERVLQAAGAIERLESRLSERAERDRRTRERAQLVREIVDLDRIGERANAVARAERWLERGPDEHVRIEADRIAGRLLEGPAAWIELDGKRLRVAFGREATIGRSGATVIAHSTAVSRQHVRLFRQDGTAWLEDLGTRNGTTIGGARLVAPVPVGSGVRLELAGQVDCRIETADPSDPEAAVVATVGGAATLLPLGPLRVGSWSVDVEQRARRSFVVVRAAAGHPPPFMGGLELGRAVELCVGDELCRERTGPVLLRVLGRDELGAGAAP